MRIETTDGLAADMDDDGNVRLWWRGHDWLGLGVKTGVALDPLSVRCSVAVSDDGSMLVFRTAAVADLTGIASGAYDQPSAGWPVFTPANRSVVGPPPGLRALAFQCCEFGLPTNAGASIDGFFLLGHRPPTGWPLLLTKPDGSTLLLAPLDAFHDQVVGLNGGSVRCGWNGDLDVVPAGTTTELAVMTAASAREALDAWAALLMARAGTVRPGRWPDALGTRPSYWTDNGAAYWYRTEPGMDPAGSIVAAVDDLRAQDVPIGSVQLDSWFYPHAELRPFDTDEWVVPPTAMIAWEERGDVLPAGIADLRARLGSPPLVAHIRHLSSLAPIAAELPVHVDGAYAAPATAAIYERWLDQCLAWGVETFEHDWLVEVFFGVRGLRERPGRARAWQEGIDRAARERGITTQWCMGTPADFAQTTTLTQVTSVRTCGDHGYIATPGQLWAWFCTTNALARALGLMPFKDVFRADPEVAAATGELEALLSALSTGPVGLGDRVGRNDAALAMRTCRADGVLIKPHVPIAATHASMFANTGFRSRAMVAECHSDHAAGRWAYVLAMHCNPSTDPIVESIPLRSLGSSSPDAAVVALETRTGAITRLAADASLDVSLTHEDWAMFVLAPLLPGEIAVFGDTSKFVSAGDARVEVDVVDHGIALTVKGAGERVTITGWAERPPMSPAATVRHDRNSGRWEIDVDVPSRGWTRVLLKGNR